MHTSICSRWLTAVIFALLTMTLAGASASVEMKDLRTFHLDFSGIDGTESMAARTVALTTVYSATPGKDVGSVRANANKDEVGKALSSRTVRMFENLEGWVASMWLMMPTGETDQAVLFEAKDRVPSDSGAITFWFRGQGWDYTQTVDRTKDVPTRVNFRDWDVHSPLRETFFELRTTSGNVTFGKLEPGKLTLQAPGGLEISLPIDFDPTLVHMVTINYGSGTASIWIDGELKADGKFAMPASVREIVVGQVGAGVERWNRWIDDFSVWNKQLSPAQVAELWRKEGMFQLPLQVAIPRADTPPAIDGIMKTGEWDNAAAVTGMSTLTHLAGVLADYGMLGELTDLKDRVFLAYDSDNLYVAYHCPPPREIAGNNAMIAVMLKKSVTAFDAAVDFDDSFKISIQYPRPGGDYYRVYVNGLNTHYEFTDNGFIEGRRLPGEPGFRKLAWDPDWTSASTLDTDGWHLEIALPLDSFDIPAPKAGDVWYVNFMRIWQTIRSGMASWAWGNRAPSDEGNELRCSPAGRVVFQDSGVTARQVSIGEIGQGKPHFVTELVNTSGEPRTVRCTVTTNSGELSDDKTVTVPAGEKVVYEYAGRIVDPRTHTITHRVTDSQTNADVLVAGYPVQRPTEADVYFRKYPSYDKVAYEVGFTNHAIYEPGEIVAEVSVKDKSGAKKWGEVLKGFKDYHFVRDIPTKSLPTGTYTTTFVFKARGKVIETATHTFDKNPMPEWYGNTLGFDGEDAPCPWQDIKVDGNSVSVWGRVYDFGDKLFPQAVSTQGKPILRSPIGISLETSEGELSPAAVAGDIRWTKVSNTRLEGIRSVKLGKLTVEHSFWIEYDGMVWSNLRLIPDSSVRVRSLAFEIPYNPAFSDVINARDYSMRNTGKLKPEGFVGSPEFIWLGNAIGGIQWCAETSGPYEVTDVNNCLKVTSSPEGGTARVDFVNKPFTLTEARDIPFGFIATPVRPKTLRTVEGDRFRRYAHVVGYWQDQEELWRPFHEHWINKSSVQRARMSTTLPGVEHRPVHHTTLMMMGARDEAMQEFGDEWLTDQTVRWRGKYSVSRGSVPVTTESRSLQDYIIWRFNEYFKKEPVAGGYFDVSMPWSSSNTYAGAGYKRADGTIAPTWSLLGHRQVLKRIYNIQNVVFPGGGLWYHASEGPSMVFMSYCVGDYDGENGNSIINADNPTYRTLLTPDNYRAQYMGTNWGFWNAFLSQGRISAETLRKYGFSDLWDQWTGVQWLHDCYCGTGWFGKIGYLEGLLSERELVPFNNYHMFSPFNRFIPYWEQTVTTVDSPEFYASFYVKQPVSVSMYGHSYYDTYDTGLDGIHQAVLIFYNHGDYKGPVRLKLDWKQLGFDDWTTVTAVNAVHSTGFRVKDWDAPTKEGELFDNSAAEYARIEDGVVVFPVTEYNYRMIVLQTPRPWKAP